MSEYSEAAPNVSKLVDEAEFQLDFPPPVEPPAPLPDPDGAKKRALYEAYVSEYRNNGGVVALARLARRQGVPPKWCQILDSEVKAAMAVFYGNE
jgi:hypothetical protein